MLYVAEPRVFISEQFEQYKTPQFIDLLWSFGSGCEGAEWSSNFVIIRWLMERDPIERQPPVALLPESYVTDEDSKQANYEDG